MIKNKVKKLALVIATFGIVSGSSLAATPEETYKEALQYSNQHADGTYTFDIHMEMPFIGSAKVTSVAQFRAKPYEMKADTTLSTQFPGKEMTKGFQSYQRQEGKSLLMYYPAPNEKEWYVYTIPLDSDAPYADTVLEKSHDNVMSGVKSVKELGQNRYRVVYDMTKLYKPGDEKKWKGMKKEDVAAAIKVLKALQAQGDFKAIVTIDPKTKRITNVSAPFTPQMKAVMGVLFDELRRQMPNKSREMNMLQAFFDNSDIDFEMTWKELPKDADLTVPKEITEKAKQTKRAPLIFIK